MDAWIRYDVIPIFITYQQINFSSQVKKPKLQIILLSSDTFLRRCWNGPLHIVIVCKTCFIGGCVQKSWYRRKRKSDDDFCKDGYKDSMYALRNNVWNLILLDRLNRLPLSTAFCRIIDKMVGSLIKVRKACDTSIRIQILS